MVSMTIKELTELYYDNSNKEVCEQLGITNPTLMSILREHRIPMKGSGNRKKRRKITILD